MHIFTRTGIGDGDSRTAWAALVVGLVLGTTAPQGRAADEPGSSIRAIRTERVVYPVLSARSPAGALRGADDQAELVDVIKIWDRAPHNAFTDLIRYRDRWFCVFREGQAHISPDGALRVITSVDGREWSSAALIRSTTADLRDAKITITPQNRLMLLGAAALHQPAAARHQSMAWFSDDGQNWSEGVKIGDPDVWLWRVTWHKGQAYGIGYATDGREFLRLYRSSDGKAFDTLVPTLYDRAEPSETSIVFLADDTAICLLRRDGDTKTALLGRSRPPYTEWSWKDLGRRVGGPHLILLPDGRIVAGGRLFDGAVRTGLCWLDPEAGTITEFLSLPSATDTSYPGFAWFDDLLWVSYYSSHEGRTSIYLARVRVPPR
jgi:hypothetical protein